MTLVGVGSLNSDDYTPERLAGHIRFSGPSARLMLSILLENGSLGFIGSQIGRLASFTRFSPVSARLTLTILLSGGSLATDDSWLARLAW